MTRTIEGKSLCVFIMEAGAALEASQGMERIKHTDPLWHRLPSKSPERCLLLSKASCCQRPEGSSHGVGSLVDKECTPANLTKCGVHFTRWPVAGIHWSNSHHRSLCPVLCLHSGMLWKRTGLNPHCEFFFYSILLGSQSCRFLWLLLLEGTHSIRNAGLRGALDPASVCPGVDSPEVLDPKEKQLFLVVTTIV